MSVDPYHAVEQEIQTTLQTASQLLASFVRIRNMAQREDSEELAWAGDELKATLTTLETDLEDLEESVKIVESTDARMFGLDDSEVTRRRNYVNHIRSEIQRMRAEVSASFSTVKAGLQTPVQPLSPQPRRASGYQSPFSDSSPAGQDDDQTAWEMEEQQMMMRDQDRTIDSIAGTLSTLAEQAGLMGQEIGVHNEMLDDLERGVDETDSKLNASMLRMRKFIRQTEKNGSGWCIVFLIVVLCALLLAVILV